MSMARGVRPRGTFQRARRGRPPNSSLAVIDTTLAESPLHKRTVTESGVQEDNDNSAASETDPYHHPDAEWFPAQYLSLLASMAAEGPPDPTLDSDLPKVGITDNCFRNIVNLFARRYITTFDRDHLALEGAYASASTFSCRYIPSTRFPTPRYLPKCNTGILQGHLSILQTISSFSRRIVFASPTKFASDVTMDVLQLPDMNYFVTLTLDTEIDGVEVSVDMVFVLKDSAKLIGRQDLLRVLWAPFVALSHQIILRPR